MVTPTKQYRMILALLFAGWQFKAPESDPRGLRLCFSRGEYEMILEQGGLRLNQNGVCIAKRSLMKFKQHPRNPFLLLEITKDLHSFDLEKPWRGMIPATEIFGELYFRSMKKLLNQFIEKNKRAPRITEFIDFCLKNRKKENLPGDRRKIRTLVEQGDMVHWVIERELRGGDQNAVWVLPLKRKKDAGNQPM